MPTATDGQSMSLTRLLRQLLNRNAEEDSYRCIHCGDQFAKDYHDCPSCGRPYVTEIDAE
jgi:lipopolysaccharide biosynthesis regulator YciM